MEDATIDTDTIPYFAWDRRLTAGEIRRQLREADEAAWARLAAWVMREAAFPDVWQFLTPRDVDRNLDLLEPFLGRKRSFWKYIIGQWHELGKL